MIRWLHIRINDETADYLDKCARVRNISRASLLRRLFDTIAEDQLAAGILDDADTLRERRKGERYFKDHGNPP